MDLKFIVLKLGFMGLLFVQQGECRAYKLEPEAAVWEDANAACIGNNNMLFPGRRYRAKALEKTLEEGQAVWLNGWRAASAATPDPDGRLSTIKVDFSRAIKKKIKVLCKMSTIFYDPLYEAEDIEEARNHCERDGATLADIVTAEDVSAVVDKMVQDNPFWVNSISSTASVIKQCLVAKRVADDVEYNYEDCDRKLKFICLRDDDLIDSFNPLISLKMARYDEFQQTIEKHLAEKPSSEILEDTSSVLLDTSATFETHTPSPLSNIVPSSAEIFDSSMESSELLSASFRSMSSKAEVFDKMQPSLKVMITSPEIVSSPVFLTPSETSAEIVTEFPTVEDISSPDLSLLPELSRLDIFPQSSLMSSGIAKTVSESLEHSASSVYDMDYSDYSKETDKEIIRTSREPVIETSVPQQTSSTTFMKPDFRIDHFDTFYFPEEKSSILDMGSKMDFESLTGLYSMPHEASPTPELMFTSSAVASDFAGPSIGILEAESLQMPVIMPTDTDYFDHDLTRTSSSKLQIDSDYGTQTVVPSMDKYTSTPIYDSKPTVFDYYTHDSLSEYESEYSIFEKTDETTTLTATTFSSAPPAYTPYIPDLSEPDFMAGTKSVSLQPSTTLLSFSTSGIVTYSSPCTVINSVSYCPDTSSVSSTSSGACTIIDSKTYCQTAAEFSSKISTDSSLMASEITDYLDFESEMLSSTYSSPCSVINSVSYCPDTSSVSSTSSGACTIIGTETYCQTTTELSSEISTYSSPMASAITDFIDFESEMLSQTEDHIQMTQKYTYDMEEDFSSILKAPVPSIEPTSTTPYSPYDYVTDYYHAMVSEKYESYSYSDEVYPSSSATDSYTPVYKIDSSERTDKPTTKMIDVEVTGDIDKAGDEDDNISNESSGRALGKPAAEGDEDSDVGLWVAFSILVVLVIVAVILAIYLWRRRQRQKSKDISKTNGEAPPPAAGETVELRDSRSPSRENGAAKETA